MCQGDELKRSFIPHALTILRVKGCAEETVKTIVFDADLPSSQLRMVLERKATALNAHGQY